jgi:hypothetical protein
MIKKEAPKVKRKVKELGREVSTTATKRTSSSANKRRRQGRKRIAKQE